MAKEDKYWNNPVNLDVDWGGDEVKTEGKPLSGKAVQQTIKNSLNSKVGYVGYCAERKTNVLTKDEESFNIFNRLITEGKDEEAEAYKLGEFQAVATNVISINVIDPESQSLSVLEGAEGVTISFQALTKNTEDNSYIREGYRYNITNTNVPNEFIGDTISPEADGNVTVNIDRLLAVGSNNITINVTGQNTNATSFKTILVKVIRLNITDDFKISTVYDLANKDVATIIVPYTVTTNAKTKIHWYVDYKEVGEPSVVLTSSKENFEYTFSKGDLVDGVHSLMYYAEYEDATSAQPFRTHITYKEFFVITENFDVTQQPLFSVSFTMPYSEDFLNGKEKLTFNGVKQYDIINLPFAIYTQKSEETIKVEVDDSLSNGYFEYASVLAEKGKVYNQKVVIENEGDAKIRLTCGNSVSHEFGFEVNKNNEIKPPYTNNMLLSLSAKNKSNEDKENRDKWESTIGGKTYKTTFEGFQWTKNNGWNDGKLIIRNGAKIDIDFKPFTDRNNFTNGFTFEIEFATTNIYDENAEICSITNKNGDAGIILTASEAIFRAGEGKTVSTKFKSGKVYRIAFVKTSTITSAGDNGRFIKIYVNGIICGLAQFSEDDSVFVNDSNIVIKGSEKASIELISLQCFNTEVSDDNILNNYMYYRTNAAERTELYTKNNIYNEKSEIDKNKLNQQLPVMVFYQIEDSKGNQQGELHQDLELEFSDKGKTIWLDIEYIDLSDPNGKFNFYWKNAGVRPQGTSSMKYPKKNYRIYTQRDSSNADLGPTEVYIGDEYAKFKKAPETAKSLEGKKRKYQFKNGSAPVKCWCLKADFAESSGTHNTGVARYWNQVLTNSGFKTKAQEIATKAKYKYDVRTTVDGFPIALFYQPLGGELQFLGKYNFNNDKSTEDVFGFTGGDEDDSKRVQFIPVGYNEPIINDGPEVVYEDTELIFKHIDEKGVERIVRKINGTEIFNNPLIIDEIVEELEGIYTDGEISAPDTPIYYAESKGTNKYLYYKLQTSDMFDNARMECWELLNSGTDVALFRRKLTGDNTKDIIDGDNEKVGYFGEDGTPNESFESRFPDCGETYHTYNLQRLIDWLTDCMYLKTEIVKDEDGNIKGKLVPMSLNELKETLGDNYKPTITIQSLTKGNTNDIFKFVTTKEDGTVVYYKEIAWDNIKDEVLGENDEDVNDKGEIIDFVPSDYRLIELTPEEAEILGAVKYEKLPTEQKEPYIYITAEDGENIYYVWGYKRVYYTTDYASLTKEVFGYNYVYDINTKKYYAWGDFEYFKDYAQVQVVENTPQNRAKKFAVEKYDHFRLDMMAAYYIYLMRFGGVDQTVKNAMLTTEGSDDNSTIDLPSKWYFINYDNDTILGVKNDGRLVFGPYITRDSIENNQVDEDGNAAYCYAGRNSTMWNNFEADLDFMEYVPTIDDELQKNANTLGYQEAIDMFNNKQSGRWSERVYNWDARVKYILPFTNREVEEEDSEGNATGAEFNYLLNVQGPRTAHREWWLSKRFNVFDSKYTTGSFKKNVVTFKCNGPSKQDDICPITSGEDIYYGYYKNNPTAYYKTDTTIKPGETWNLTVTANSTIGDPHAIFGSPNIEKIDFRNIAYRITEIQMAGIRTNELGTKLTTLLIGDKDNPKLNKNFSNFGAVSNMEKLEELDVTGCQGLTLNAGDLRKLKNLRNLYLAGTITNELDFSDGGDITNVELPTTIGSLKLYETVNLTWDSLKFININENGVKEQPIDFGKLTKLRTVEITSCPNLLGDYNKFLSWLESYKEFNNGGLGACTLSLDRIEWHVNKEDIDRFAIFNELSSDFLHLKGKIYIDQKLTLEQVNMFTSIFGNGCFTENAELEIIALPGIYVSKHGSTKDFILEGDEYANQYKILTIGFKGTVKDINITVFEELENSSMIAGPALTKDVNLKDLVINLTLDEVERVIKKLRLSVTCKEVTEDDETINHTSGNFYIDVRKRTYPSIAKMDSRNSISNTKPTEFKLTLTNEDGETNFNGNYYVEWQISGEAVNDGLVGFSDNMTYSGTTCSITATELNNKSFTLTATVLREVEEKVLTVIPSISKTIILKNENILLTYNENPALWRLLNDYGFIGSKGYLETSYAQTVNENTVCPNDETKTFKDIFSNYLGFKSIETLDKVDVLFTDFSILSYFGLSMIPNGMFSGCSNLTTVEIPVHITNIGSLAFNGCKNLKLFDMPSVENIGDSAFSGCSAFTQLVLKNNVKTIGANAFNGCTKLETVEFGDNVTEIGNNIFNGCTKLETVNLGGSIKIIPNNTFNNCKNLREVQYGDITEIKNNAFTDCELLEVLNIPETLTTIEFSIDNSPFMGCNKLVFEGGNETYIVDNGTLYYQESVDKKWILRQNPNVDIVTDETLYAAAYSMCGMAINNLTVPYNVIFAGKSIFYKSSGDSITMTKKFSEHEMNERVFHATKYNAYRLHDDETIIPKECFYYSSNLQIIELPNTILEIRENAFIGCMNIATLCIPQSVTKIGRTPFHTMNKLVSLTFEGTTPPSRKNDKGVNEDLFYDIGNVVMYIKGDSFDTYVETWNDYEKMFRMSCLPSEGYFRIIRDAEIYDGNDVTIGGLTPTYESNGYYHFQTNETVTNTDIKLGNNKIGVFNKNYVTVYTLSNSAENKNMALYDENAKGVDFTRGIVRLTDYFDVISGDAWTYDVYLGGLKSNANRSTSNLCVLKLKEPEKYVENGFITITLGQASEKGYDFFNVIYEHTTGIDENNPGKPYEIDIIEVKNGNSDIGKTFNGLKGIMSNYIKIRFKYVDGQDVLLRYHTDSSRYQYANACWLYTIGEPIFIEPELADEYIEEITIKVNPIATSLGDTIYPPKGLRVKITNDRYFEQYVLLDENGQVTVKLPKNDEYHIECENYLIDNKPYYFKEVKTITTNGSNNEVILEHMYLMGNYSVKNGVMNEGYFNNSDYYIYADDENDYYIAPIKNKSAWSTNNFNGVNEEELYIYGTDVIMNPSLLFTQHTDGYENTATIRKKFVASSSSWTLANKANSKNEFNDIIEWYIPSYAEVYNIWSNFKNIFPNDTKVWTSNLEEKTTAWSLDTTNGNHFKMARNTENNIMYVGRFRI